MQVEPLSRISHEEWDRYVRRHPHGTIFHLSSWSDVIHDSTGHEPAYFAAMDEGILHGVLPLFILKTRLFGRMGVSLPFLNLGGILADSPVAAQALAEESERIARRERLKYIELRQRHPTGLGLPVSERKVVSVIPLEGGPDAVFARLHQNVRNKIRKAEKSEVIVERGPEGLADFYRVYSRNLRDLGTPVMPRRFFECIMTAFPESARIYVARLAGKAIGAKFVLTDRRTCYFIWAAALREELKHAPVHALNWAAIRDACEAGCAEVDMGRSSAESSHQDFKKYWGVDVHPLPWTYQLTGGGEIPGLNPDNPKFALAVRVWKRLPVFFTRLVGPTLAIRLP